MNLWCESNATSSKTSSLHVHWDNVLTVQTNISRSLVFSALILLRYASVLNARCIIINSPIEFCTFLPFHVSYYATAVIFIAMSSMYTWCTLFMHFDSGTIAAVVTKKWSNNKSITTKPYIYFLLLLLDNIFCQYRRDKDMQIAGHYFRNLGWWPS